MKKGKDGVYAVYIKRAADFILALIALVVLSPVFLILTVFGAIAMKGNPFFVQERPGVIDPKTGEEKIFKLIKFRTMSNARDKNGNLLPDGKRLNKYGKILRASSLDELSEILNIIKGDMSFIGPRPLLVEYIPYYTAAERHRHDVRPGLTGWAQVNGRNAVFWDKRFQYDIEYVNNISLKFDFLVFLKTVIIVLKHSDVSVDPNTLEGNFANVRKKQQEMLR